MKIFISAVIILVLTSCIEPYLITPEYHAYELAFKHILQNPRQEILVLDHTDLNMNDGKIISDLANRYGPEIKDFPAQPLKKFLGNKSSTKLEWRPIIVKVRYISNMRWNQNNALDKNELWNKLMAAYPMHEGYYSLSRVEYDKQTQKIILSIAYVCKEPCTSQEFLFYIVKDKGEWVIKKQI